MLQTVGKALLERRRRMGISQEELCDGICSQPSLSKIESGQQMPRADQLEALAQRLGLPIQSCIILMDEKELERHDLQAAFHHDISNMNYEEAEKKAQRLKFLDCRDSPLLDQFLSYADVLLGMHQYGPLKDKKRDELLERMLPIIKQTVHDIDLENCRFSLLTVEEIRMVNTVGNLYSTTGNKNKAIEIYIGLVRYCCSGAVAISDVEEIVPMILFNLGRNLGIQSRYEDCISVSSYAEEYCIEHTQSFMLGLHLYNKGCALYHLGQTEKSQETLLLARTYMLCNRQKEGVRQIDIEIKKFFGIETSPMV